MKRILCSLLVATLPFGSVLADAALDRQAREGRLCRARRLIGQRRYDYGLSSRMGSSVPSRS